MKLSEKITQAMLEGQVDFSDAYQGAMEEVAIWKRRALEAEDLNRKFVAEINGPAYMGEPAQPAPSVPDGVAEAMQRLIENGAVLGPASSEDALLVARYRQRLLACAPSVPEGWKLVPIEPTKEMRDAWDSAPICEDDDAEFRRAYSEMIAAATEAKARKITPGAQPAPSVPEGFSREDLESVADGLDGYEKTVNVGNVTGEGDDHLESTTAYAARFIRAMLAAAPEAKP